MKDYSHWSEAIGGSVTQYRYNSLGAVTEQIENALATSAQRRITAYEYTQGKLTKMGAITNGDADTVWQSGVVAQVTGVGYGAEVYDEATNTQVSRNGSLVSSVYFPDKSTGAASSAAGLTFTYYPDGMLRSRTDARGMVFRYSYDELGNLKDTAVDYTNAQYPAGLVPVDQLCEVRYTYDTATGELIEVLAATKDLANNNNQATVSDDVFGYDSRGNLLFEQQSHGALAATASAEIDYTWAYSPAVAQDGTTALYNFDRLASMIYPAKPISGNRRLIELHRGDDLGSADSILGRVTRESTTDSGSTQELARYAYCGTGRKVDTKLGYIPTAAVCAVMQTFTALAGGSGYPGLDAWGRPKDLAFIRGDSSQQILAEHLYAYDSAGQRTSTHVTQYSSTGTGHVSDNQRSWHFGYDALDRLTGADTGALDSGQTGVTGSTQLPVPRLESWTMDSLGNWVGDGSNAGRTVSADWGSGSATQKLTTLPADRVNEATAVVSDVRPGSNPVTVPLVYDQSGNLALDGVYFYQYDAWGRLVSVRNQGTLAFDLETGQYTGTAGSVICQFTFDGLGRLVRKLTPYPGYTNQWRTEHYYYDGVRRVQEVFSDPIASNSPFTSKNEKLDLQPTTWCDREYAWDAAAGAYVDHCVAQFDGYNRTAFVLQDASEDVIALVGPASLSGGGTGGSVIEQYGWDPYGELLFKDVVSTSFSSSRLGHQGLFLDRIDADCLHPTLAVNPVSQPAVVGLYQNRNRTYAPGIGRFLQRDPNASGLNTALNRSPHGGLELPTAGLNIDSMAVGNLYSYVDGNPLMNSDPSGLILELFGPTSTEELELDHAQNVLSGAVQVAIGILNISNQYAGTQDAVADWADDMSLADDLFAQHHGRIRGQSSSDTAAQAGISGADGEDDISAGVAGAGGARRTLKVADIGKRVRIGAVYKSYGEARYAVRTSGQAGLNCHHIVEVRHLERLGKSTNGPAVVLSRAQHLVITAKLRKVMPYGRGYKLREIRNAYQQVYQRNPELLRVALDYLEGFK